MKNYQWLIYFLFSKKKIWIILDFLLELSQVERAKYKELVFFFEDQNYHFSHSILFAVMDIYIYLFCEIQILQSLKLLKILGLHFDMFNW